MTAHELEPEAPEVMARTAMVGSQLLASATAFFFLAFVFGFFYLRSLDSDKLWKPKGIDAPTGLGTAFIVLVVLGAIAMHLGGRSEKSRAAALGAGLALCVAALVVQAIEWSQLGFGPTEGGYASVFVGWTGFYFLFLLIATLYVEVEFANAVRKGGRPDGLKATTFYLSFLAGIGVLTWVVLFLV